MVVKVMNNIGKGISGMRRYTVRKRDRGVALEGENVL